MDDTRPVYYAKLIYKEALGSLMAHTTPGVLRTTCKITQLRWMFV